jgi:hypothetical protein
LVKAKYQCPCCENYTLDNYPNGTFEVCPVCGYEIDYADTFNYCVGVTKYSLAIAKGRENYQKFGAINKKMLKSVRKPLKNELPPKTSIKKNAE